MSRKPDTNIETQIIGLEELKRKFDIVEIDDSHEKYNILTCKDIVRRGGTIINYIVWLQLKINKSHEVKNNYSTKKDSKTYLEDCLKDLNLWVELLINFDKKNTKQRLSLFEEDNVEILEKEPDSPRGGEDNTWNSNNRKVEKVRKNNLLKQYSFFELFNEHSSLWLYTDIDWRKFLPTQDEFVNMFKNIILKYKDNPGRYDDGWFDDEYNWITRDGALSDFELFERVRFETRLYLLPYKHYGRVSTDLSFSHTYFEESIDYRFYFNNGKLESYGSCDYDKKDLPKYNLYSEEFINWLRETFNVPFKEIDLDDEVLRSGIEQFLDSYLWYGREEYNWQNRIKNFKDWKSFKNDFFNFKKEKNINNNGGSSFSSWDGFSGSLDFDKSKYGLTIVQDKKLREMLNRNIITTTEHDNKSLVFELKGDEVFKKAFELFGSSINQLSLKEIKEKKEYIYANDGNTYIQGSLF